MMWPSGQTSRASLDVPQNVSAAEEVQNRILALHAETEAQRWHKGQALALTEDVVRTRFLVLGSSRGAVSEAFLVVVIFWLTATFASFGLYAPRNTTVTTVLFIAALSVAAAVFLILELDGPFTGVIRISSAPLRYALDQIGK
jgi:hypothetical protein